MPAYLIEDASGLDPGWLDGVSSVGITAGASAPEDLVQDVIATLRRRGRVRVSTLPGIEEACASVCRSNSNRPPLPKSPSLPLPSELKWLFLCCNPLMVGAYVVGRHLRGVKRYPLVLMLEPLFRCNLACAGCGKIDYPDPLLNRRLSVDECLEAARDCGAPVVSIAGGEPLLHAEMDQVVQG